MEHSITMYITIVATSGVLTLFLCLYAIVKRQELSGHRTFVLYTAAQSVYIFACAFEMASASVEEVKRWTVVEYIGISTAPALGLMLVLNYIGKPVSRKGIALLFVIPILTMIMVTTNDVHLLMYTSVEFGTETSGPIANMDIGPYFIVHGLFTLACMMTAAILLMRVWRETRKNYRRQLVTLIFGQFLPLLAAFVYLMGMTPYGIDPVPIVLFVTSALYIWAMVSTQMLTVVPIAKEIIFESMGEGVLVLDSSLRLIDYNGTAARMLPGLSSSMIGIKLDEAWIRLAGYPFPVKLGEGDVQEELVWFAQEQESYYQVRYSSLRGRAGERVGSLLMLIDVTEQRRLQDQLKKLAYYDGLTDILNRATFIHRAQELLRQSEQEGHPIACILLDIDRFKHINDTYGHDAGDRAIVHVVAVIQRLLSRGELFGRYGGEEFVILLPSPSIREAGETGERIRHTLEEHPLEIDDRRLVITASFGISHSSGSGNSLEVLLRDADAALYQAKREGRNQVRLFEDGGAGTERSAI
ncbi:histidine kinase N-terminal 7TM domain-containing diguanylate cyclase [Paenibacillus puerhi]|uniref:histidine kinase N-terminal 7TM domain-containing diguanylate cyclase n=1 Tax=Paenibacillus puerhi TaxID=2692622 RepID=UPI00135A7873|nr:histidine kinase N-terminal 7TM domain-containing protein [Paenibacillus puerhi]